MHYPEKSVMLQVVNGKAVCPKCGWDGQQRVRPDTVLIKFPLYCRKCKTTSVVDYIPESQSHRARAD